MGPRPISRGEAICSHQKGIMIMASMGPRPISRGESMNEPEESTALLLQWGRGRSAAERP